MRLPRCVFIGTILLSAGILVGCEGSSSMKNMKVPEGGKEEDVTLKSKGGKTIKEVPPIPPDAEAPPLRRK